jgi:hypothetical protein
MSEPILINSIPDWAAFGVGDEVFFLVAAAFPCGGLNAPR